VLGPARALTLNPLVAGSIDRRPTGSIEGLGEKPLEPFVFSAWRFGFAGVVEQIPAAICVTASPAPAVLLEFIDDGFGTRRASTSARRATDHGVANRVAR
jgi:hypothetical protein